MYTWVFMKQPIEIDTLTHSRRPQTDKIQSKYHYRQNRIIDLVCVISRPKPSKLLHLNIFRFVGRCFLLVRARSCDQLYYLHWGVNWSIVRVRFICSSSTITHTHTFIILSIGCNWIVFFVDVVAVCDCDSRAGTFFAFRSLHLIYSAKSGVWLMFNVCLCAFFRIFSVVVVDVVLSKCFGQKWKQHTYRDHWNTTQKKTWKYT